MMRPNENALTPASLATDGEQGGIANAGGAGRSKHTRPEADALILALSATDEARAQLRRYAGPTDAPVPCTVEAADLLDAARELPAGGSAMTACKLAGNRCQCPACGERFNSVSVFDRHRVGDFAGRGEWRHSRRCLSSAEMTLRGWSRSAAGFWIRQPREAVTVRVQGPRMTPPATGVQGATR